MYKLKVPLYIVYTQCSKYMEAVYAGPPHLFSLPHRAHAIAENLGSESPHTYFFCNLITAYT